MHRDASRVMVPSLGEVRLTFQDLVKAVEFCSRRVAFGALEFLFEEEQ